MSTEVREEPAAEDRRPTGGDKQIRLAMWGAAGGGKTTFLAALRVATLQASGAHANWQMYGLTKQDNKILSEQWEEFVAQGHFPAATLTGADHGWHLNGELIPNSRGLRRLFAGRSRHVDLALVLHDIPGGAFVPGGAESEEMTEYLSRADGLIYIYDPVRDLSTSDPADHNLKYFQGVIAELQRIANAKDRSGLIDGRLPQSVAVCVTKFDDPAVFNLAMEYGWVNPDQDGVRMPRIADDDAKPFFDWLCGQMPNNNADLLRRFIDTNFTAERVRYFATSAIGFYVGESRVFDEGDPNNLVLIEDVPTIRGPIRPINVLEPLLWLERSTRKGHQR
jgi:hypothetical protein